MISLPVMRNLILATGIAGFLCGLPAASAAQTPQAAGLKIVVIAGEGAVNVIQQKSAVAPVIEVRDRNNLPVSGAVVTFSIGTGQAATFGAGLQTLTVTTNAAGQATALGLTPTATGALQIQATAAFQGQIASATIAQTNVATAAQVAAAGGAGSAGASGAATGAAGGGVGLSGTTIGILGAAVGGGALVATQAGGGDAAPPVPAPLPIARDDRYSMARGSVLTVAPPGVLLNDTVAPEDLAARPAVEFAPFSTFPENSAFTNIDRGSGGFIFDLTLPGARDIVGTVVLRYIIHTTRGDSNIATVFIDVTP